MAPVSHRGARVIPLPRDGAVSRRRMWEFVIALVFALGAPSHAQAQCRVAVDSAVAFGPYNVFNTSHVDTTGRISWRCPGNSPMTVQITITRGANGDATSRRLAMGDDFLRYDLYRDAARTIVWGDGTYGGSYTAVYPGGGWIPVTIYARIPKEQDAAAGTYSDTITVVINF
jgi:spore coat protein U-like protein